MPLTARNLRPLTRITLISVLFFALASMLLAGPVASQESGDTIELSPESLGQPGEPESDPGPDPGGLDSDDPAQEPAAPVVREVVDDTDRAVQIIEYDSSGFPSVDIVVSVPPALAGELAQQSFSLTENGRVRSADLAKLRDALEVLLVIDTSGSMTGDPIEAATAAAQEFITSLDGETDLAVIGFGASAETKAGFGSTRAEVSAAIEGLNAGGETSLYDALVLASSEFGDTAARRFVVVLSDGRDTASLATAEDASSALLSAQANLYAITLESPDADFEGLSSLATDVGGVIVSATDTESLTDTYAAIASRLSNQYRLSYRASRSGEVDVAIAVDANGLIAYAAQTINVGSAAAVTGLVEPVDEEPAAAASSIDTSNPTVTVLAADTGILGSNNAIYIGGGAVFLGVLLVLFTVLSVQKSGPSAMDRLNFKRPVQRGGIASIADRAAGLADRMLEKQEKRGALDDALEKAGLDMRPGEYLMASAGVSIGLAVFGLIMFGLPAAGAFLLLGLLGGRVYVNSKAKKRQKMFGKQLGDTLMMIAGSLRAGHGVVEAIDTVATQTEAPTGEEFTRAVAESRIGRDMVESLYDIAERTGSEDFIWVVRAISINRELGGDLAEILDNVGDTIRDRNRLRDQVRALSAEGKVSALILFALPIFVGGWVQMANPEYLESMTGETMGKVALGGAFAMLTIGGVWLKKLVNVEF